ncbi:MAG: hypothetical protein ACRC62_02585, partial [Microcoleus sp.]
SRTHLESGNLISASISHRFRSMDDFSQKSVVLPSGMLDRARSRLIPCDLDPIGRCILAFLHIS